MSRNHFDHRTYYSAWLYSESGVGLRALLRRVQEFRDGQIPLVNVISAVSSPHCECVRGATSVALVRSKESYAHPVLSSVPMSHQRHPSGCSGDDGEDGHAASLEIVWVAVVCNRLGWSRYCDCLCWPWHRNGDCRLTAKGRCQPMCQK